MLAMPQGRILPCCSMHALKFRPLPILHVVVVTNECLSIKSANSNSLASKISMQFVKHLYDFTVCSLKHSRPIVTKTLRTPMWRRS